MRVAELLTNIEWAGDDHHFVCPACRRDRQHGHGDGCPLAMTLSRLSVWQTAIATQKECAAKVARIAEDLGIDLG